MASPTYRLETLGTVVLKGPDLAIRAADQRQQRRRLGLLAALASAGDRGMSRDQLLLLFWPESTQKKARHSLDQLLYAIRTSLGESIFRGTNPIRLNSAFISSDVSEFNAHLAAGRLEAATAAYTGAFLDGFYLSDTREFEEWAEGERRRLAHAHENALEQLALDAEHNGDTSRAVHWRRQLCETDPVSTRNALSLMRALANAGDVSSAIAYGERYARDAADTVGASGLATVGEMVTQLRTVPDAQELLPLAQSRQIRSPGWIPQRKRRVSAYTAFAVIAAVGAGVTILSAGQAREPRRDAEPRGTANLAAYDLYLRAREQVVMRNDSTARLALASFQEATRLDPEFAAAHAGMATMYTRLAMGKDPHLPRPELRRRAIAAAQRAIALDDSLADAHRALGLINSYWLIDLAAARRHLERAVVLDPKDPQSREYLAIVYLYLGRQHDALREARQAIAQNPLAPTARATLAVLHYVAGRCDLAWPSLDSLAAMRPPLLRVPITRSLCHASAGDWPNAVSAVRDAAASGEPRTTGMLGLALARNGSRSEAIDLRRKLRETASTNPAAWFDAGVISFGLGDIDAAMDELRRGTDAGVHAWEILGPVFDDLRADPRYRRLAASKGIKEIVKTE